MKPITRRDLLNVMGLGAGTLFLPSLLGDKKAYAQGGVPKRLFVYYTPHGPVQQNYTMRAGKAGGWSGSTKNDRGQSLSFNLPDSAADYSPILAPLAPLKNKVLALEGLAMTSALLDKSTNNHNAGTSHALTGAKMVLPGGFKQEGGGGDTSVDQLVADKIADPKRIKSLYYTTGGWSPIFRGKAEQTGQASLEKAYDRMFPVSVTGDATADFIKKRRAKALAMVRDEYAKVVPKLSGEDKRKLEDHFDMVNEMGQQVDFRSTVQCSAKPSANPSGTAKTHPEIVAGFGSIITAALACDLTRVAVLTNGGISGGDAVALLDVHTDLHLDIAHNASPNNPDPFMKMTRYYTLLAQEFADILKKFDAVTVDGGKTLLDNTVCLWVCELANGPHDMHDIMAVVAGGGETGAFTLGRYVKYAESGANPRGGTGLGPAHNKLLVSVMKAFGVEQSHIGMRNADFGQNGKYDLEGTLPMLKA